MRSKIINACAKMVGIGVVVFSALIGMPFVALAKLMKERK